ncbi:MAG: alpha/beta hydrolase [Pseudohongiellaceae bacterium]
MPEFVRRYPAFIASLVLIFGGGLLAWLVQTGVGSIEVRDVRFLSPSGATLSALLYVPDTASADHPAPAVLAVHGYINSRETQSPYAIEFARRGYVVLALDQRGHGFSTVRRFGGPAALAPSAVCHVDTDQVVLAGHGCVLGPCYCRRANAGCLSVCGGIRLVHRNLWRSRWRCHVPAKFRSGVRPL